jgi:hypothetical protein
MDGDSRFLGKKRRISHVRGKGVKQAGKKGYGAGYSLLMFRGGILVLGHNRIWVGPGNGLGALSRRKDG